MIEIKSPAVLPDYPNEIYMYPRVFLAGSIENGTASNWHEEILESNKGFDVVMYNPRRDSWDPKWTENGSQELINQIDWEHEHIFDADIVFFYFDPNTKSPITLMELGMMVSDQGKQAIVCCPKEFWRYQNVKSFCENFKITFFEDFIEAADSLTIDLIERL